MNKLTKIFMTTLIVASIGQTAVAALNDEVYSGVYKKEFQLIPNTMATLCKISADDVVSDVQKLKDCVSKLALKRRSSDAEISREGLKDLNQIKADELKEMVALSAAKSAAVTGYFALTGKEANDLSTKSATVNDVDASAINTTKVLTSVVNSLRDLYVEQLKSVAISSIENIERDAVLEIASLDEIKEAEKQVAEKNKPSENEKEAESSDEQGTDSSGSGVSQPAISNNMDMEVSTELRVLNGVCNRCTKNGDEYECRQEVCPDGEYADANNSAILYVCKDGECEQVDLRAKGDEQ